MKIKARSYDAIGTLAMLTLVSMIVLCMTSMVVIGANVYISIEEDMEENYMRRTPIAYMTNKIRQNDKYDCVTIINEPHDLLVLKEVYEEIIYETWIYEYDGYLYELYIEEGTEVELEDGMPIMEVNGLKMHQDVAQLSFSYLDPQGETISWVVTLRSGGSY